MSGKTFYVYELCDPQTHKAFYVGKGTKNRMYNHVSMAKTNKKMNQRLKSKIIALNFIVEYHKVFETNSEHNAYKKEAELIEYYGLNNLCNFAKAGPDWKDADCKKLRKQLSDWQTGRKLPKYHKDAIIAAHKRKDVSEKEEQVRIRRYGCIISEDIPCPKCGNIFHREYREKASRKNIKQFCSRICANTRQHNNITKEKLALAAYGNKYGIGNTGMASTIEKELERRDKIRAFNFSKTKF